MWDDRRTGGQGVVTVRQSDGDGHADGLIGSSYRWLDGDGWSDRLRGSSYRWLDGDGWSDRLVYRVGEWSDDVGHPDGHGKMVYRWSDWDGRSDGQIVGLTGGVTDCWTDCAYDVQTGMMDRLAVVQTDSATDLRVE